MFQAIFEFEEGIQPFIVVKTMIPRGMKESKFEITRNEFVKYVMTRPKLLKPVTELQERVCSSFCFVASVELDRGPEC